MALKHAFNTWEWMRDKVMPSLIIMIVIGVAATYIQVQRLGDSFEHTRGEVAELRTEVNTIKEAYVKRIELTEVLKRVEQQLEIVLLKARENNRGK